MWKVASDDRCAVIDDVGLVAEATSTKDARLIASAPRLLQALKDLYFECEMISNEWASTERAKALAAILEAGDTLRVV
jgi:hypothetical protein